MKLALLGYGAMNRIVEVQAHEQKHEITFRLSSRSIVDSACETNAPRNAEIVMELLRGADAAIDFSVPSAVLTNTEMCMRVGVPLVIGTTGWKTDEKVVRNVVLQHDGALVYGANFSIGVNLFYSVVRRAAELFNRVEAYAPFIEESHHARKKDAPSGTALKLKDVLGETYADRDVPITSLRAGYIPGTHVVGFDSQADQVTLTHTARSREGFAAGALLAAEWITKRRGVYEFSEALDEILAERMNGL